MTKYYGIVRWRRSKGLTGVKIQRCGKLLVVVDGSHASAHFGKQLGRQLADALLVYIHNEQAALSQGKDNVDFGEYWDDMTKWSFGHPAIRQLANGKILVAFYAGSPQCMSIRWARIDGLL